MQHDLLDDGLGEAMQAVILFDSGCNLCNWSVQFILQRDCNHYFRFASLQSSVGQHMLRSFGISANWVESVVLIEHGQLFTESAAALRIARHLGGLWPLLRAATSVPRFLRDGSYRWIARHRYRWFGRSAACQLMTSALRTGFLGHR